MLNEDVSPSYDRSSSRPEGKAQRDTSPSHDLHSIVAEQTANDDEAFRVPTSAQLSEPTSSPPLSHFPRGPQPQRLPDLMKRRLSKPPKSSSKIYPAHMGPPHKDSPHKDSPRAESPHIDPPSPSEPLPAKRQRKLQFETFDFTGADEFQGDLNDAEVYDEEADLGADTESVFDSTNEDDEDD
ncbi:hypothetical protein KCU65_g4719, partial [Aureobasidium melanogenum]